MSLLTAKDREEIERAIEEVERRTAAEIVVTRTSESDSYQDVRFFVAGWCSLAGATLLHVVFPALHIAELLGLQVVLALASYFLSGHRPLLRRLVPRGRREAAVERAASLAFMRHGVFRTKDRTGVLILLSELEHKVSLLGDEGVHELLQEAGWSQMVGTIVEGIRTGRPSLGICTVIHELGEVLARGAPIQPDDTNELPNRVRDEDAEP